MKSVRLFLSTGAILVVLLTSGCASYKIQPTASSITVTKAASPIPATIGINHVEQKVSGGFPDLAMSVKHSLDQSSLFQAVYYPLRPTDQLDGTFSLRLSARLKTDGGLFFKAFITGFFLFLPTPLVTYNHEYQAECSMDLMRGDKSLKTYTAKSTVLISHKLFASPDRIEAEGTEAATKLLGAKVVEELINDRKFLEHELHTAK
jgi:hypothetical protein